MGILKDIAPAMITGGTGLVGGVLGSIAQSNANKTNLAIARETNAANERINAANLAWQREALQSQQNYSSFANQMKMAREANINPYSALGNPASAAGGGTPVSHAMQAAHVEPVNDFAHALGRSGSEMANTMSLIAAANKAQEEAKGARIDNLTKGAINQTQLQLMGKDAEAKALDVSLKQDTYDAMVENASLLNQKLAKENALFDIEKDIRTFTKDKILPEQLNKILQEIQLIQEKGLTEQSQRSLNAALAKAHITSANAAMIQAKVQQSLAPSQIGLNNAMAQNQRAQAELNQVAKDLKMVEYKVADKYAMISADADFVHKLLSNKLDRQQIWKYYNENRMLEKGIRWFEFSKFCEHPMLFSFFGQMFDTDTAK